jgi:GT2 family glycosyltransferase
MSVELSIVIVNWNTRELLLDCLASVYATVAGVGFEVWLVDNASVDGSVNAARERFPAIRVIENAQNRGFAAAANQALKRVAARYALLLNTDAVVTQGAVKRLLAFMQRHPDAAMACGQLLNTDGTRQNSMANCPGLLTLLVNETVLRVLMPERFPSKRRIYHRPIAVESCIGACIIVRRAAIDNVGLLDERYFFFMEETDWALRMRRAGWRVYFVPDAMIVHAQGRSVGSGARSRILFYRSRYQYFKKWYPRHYWLYRALVQVRLWTNALLTFAGVMLTLGRAPGLRRKLGVYGRLLAWHRGRVGCPEEVA